MNQLDVYYRALLNYNKEVSENRDCLNLRSSIAGTDIEKEKITVVRSNCKIDKDWVEEIEKGLIHIEKAIKEERQFIRSNGDVVPIEKVKHVSKESVEHLAKHSNLITRYEEGEDIIPDKLYTVERLNDYAVYENRFLYMLLCYLRDFITLRYNNILNITNKYRGSLTVNKDVTSAKQKLSYKIELSEERRDDQYLKTHNPAQPMIDRIDLILKTVLAFLATPLMEYASKAPMLKPPITKTNVLKMNNNFKGAVALYDYIIAYNKPGYTIETTNTDIAPFRPDVADELAENAAMASFIVYSHGLGIRQALKNSYLSENERRKHEQINKRQEKLKALERKVKSSEVSLEEYTLMLEKQLREIEGEFAKIPELRATIAELTEKEEKLSRTIETLNCTISEFDSVLEEEKQRSAEEISALRQSHSEEIDSLNSSFSDRMKQMNEQHAEELRDLDKQYRDEITELHTTVSDMREQHRNDMNEAEEKVAAYAKERDDAVNEKDSVMDSLYLAEGRVKALRARLGDTQDPEDHTTREGFNRLEAEYKAFTRLYKAEWSKTKKRIRKDILNIQNLKG